MNTTLHPHGSGSLRRALACLSAATLFATAASSAHAALLSHWTFDSITGTDKPFFPDATGNRAAFIKEKDKVTLHQGDAPFGKAAHFNGESGAYLTARPNFGFNKLSITVAVWINPAKVAPNFVVSDWEASPKSSFIFGIDPAVNRPTDKNYLIADLTGTNTRSRTDPNRRSVVRSAPREPIAPDQWHHVAWVWDRTSPTEGRLTTYLNGKEIAAANQSRTAANPNNLVDVAPGGPDFRIGSREMGDIPFSGAMDELWVFNEALKPEQILNLMAHNNLGGTGNVSKLVQKNPDGTVVLASVAKPEPPKTPEPKPADPKPTPPKPAEPAVAQAPPPPPAPATPTAPPREPNTAALTPPTPRPSPTETRTPPASPPAVASRNPDPAPSEAARSTPTTPRSMGNDVVARIPSRFTPARISGILACATLAIFLGGFLIWAMGEKAKMKPRPR